MYVRMFDCGLQYFFRYLCDSEKSIPRKTQASDNNKELTQTREKLVNMNVIDGSFH